MGKLLTLILRYKYYKNLVKDYIDRLEGVSIVVGDEKLTKLVDEAKKTYEKLP